jgi:Tfp pilus assembly protein PilO
MALSHREKMLVTVTIAVVVIGGHYLLVAPLNRRWAAVNGKLKTQAQLLEAMKATLAHQPGWQKEYDDLKAKVGAETTGQFSQTSDVLKKIQDVGNSTGIQISNLRPLITADKDMFRELPVQCTFEADITSLVKFLHELQSSSGFMSVEELKVSGKPDNPNILRCDIQVRALAGKSTGGTGS